MLKRKPISRQIEDEIYMAQRMLLEAEGERENARARALALGASCDMLGDRIDRLKERLIEQRKHEGSLCSHGDSPDDCPDCRH